MRDARLLNPQVPAQHDGDPNIDHITHGPVSDDRGLLISINSSYYAIAKMDLRIHTTIPEGPASDHSSKISLWEHVRSRR